MGDFTILPNTSNQIAAATLTASSADSNYPAANVALLPITKAWRTTGKTSESLLMDFGTAQAMTFFAIVNHNLSSGATITLKAGTTSGVTDFTQAITWRAGDAYAIFASQNYRYWKLELADTGNALAYLEIGYICIGAKTSYSFGPAYDTPRIVDIYENVEVESEYGAIHVNELFNRVQINFDFKVISSANETTLKAMFAALKRNVYPLFLILDSDLYEGYFGRFRTNPTRRLYIHRDVDGFEFLSDGRGRSLAS